MLQLLLVVRASAGVRSFRVNATTFNVSWGVRPRSTPPGNGVDLVSVLPLSKSVCLIRVVDQVHVVGVTNTQISYIATLDDDEVDQIDQWLGSSRTGTGDQGGSSDLTGVEKIQQLIQQFGKRS